MSLIVTQTSTLLSVDDVLVTHNGSDTVDFLDLTLFLGLVVVDQYEGELSLWLLRLSINRLTN